MPETVMMLWTITMMMITNLRGVPAAVMMMMMLMMVMMVMVMTCEVFQPQCRSQWYARQSPRPQHPDNGLIGFAQKYKPNW